MPSARAKRLACRRIDIQAICDIISHMAEVPDLGPLSPGDVRAIVLGVLQYGQVSFSRHAREEMENDDLHTTDCVNVLRGGVYEPPELIGGTWRYRVSTQRICVVIAIPAQDRVRVVTAWRI